MKVILPNSELKETETPGTFIGWREKDGCHESIQVIVAENVPVVTDNIETTTITVQVKTLNKLNPSEM